MGGFTVRPMEVVVMHPGLQFIAVVPPEEGSVA